MSKVMGIFVKFLLFYDARSPIMVIPRNPRSKFRKFLFYPNSTFNIRKVTQFLVEKLSTWKTISQKPHGGLVENTHRFRVKELWGSRIVFLTLYIQFYKHFLAR